MLQQHTSHDLEAAGGVGSQSETLPMLLEAKSRSGAQLMFSGQSCNPGRIHQPPKPARSPSARAKRSQPLQLHAKPAPLPRRGRHRRQAPAPILPVQDPGGDFHSLMQPYGRPLNRHFAPKEHPHRATGAHPLRHRTRPSQKLIIRLAQRRIWRNTVHRLQRNDPEWVASGSEGPGTSLETTDANSWRPETPHCNAVTGSQPCQMALNSRFLTAVGRRHMSSRPYFCADLWEGF